MLPQESSCKVRAAISSNPKLYMPRASVRGIVSLSMGIGMYVWRNVLRLTKKKNIENRMSELSDGGH